MSTPAQVHANQKNAQLSTGPRTPEGKTVSSQNAFRHGLTSKQIVLPGEDAALFDAMRQAHIDELKPATFLESWYLDDMVGNEWRRRRVVGAQTLWLTEEARAGADMTSIVFTKQLATFHRYESAYRRASESAYRKLKALQKERKAAQKDVPAPAAPAKIQNEAKSTAAVPADIKPASLFADMLTPEYTAKMAASPIYSFRSATKSAT